MIQKRILPLLDRDFWAQTHLVRHEYLWQEDSHLHLLTELCQRGTLAQYVSSGGLTEYDVLNFALQICYGLAFIHQRGIVHMDIKPENIYVAEDEVLSKST